MKLIRLFPVVIATVVFASACNSGDAGHKKEQITAKWHMTDMSGKETEDLPDSTKQQMFKDASVEFMDDGKYVMNGMGGDSKTGTWKFGDGENTLITTEDGTAVVDTVNIVELSSKKLVVKDSKSDLKITFSSN